MQDQPVQYGSRPQNQTMVLDGEQADGITQLPVGFHLMLHYTLTDTVQFTHWTEVERELTLPQTACSCRRMPLNTVLMMIHQQPRYSACGEEQTLGQQL